ncbi:electron transport protein SCO1/SenC [Cellulophaga algicola DSM 14237]|uniref:Electron transport protein SCO1/SenC n=1 Tax=Cellulophaga algicola (strain DSM 14237 / IC166 / ACAM 630) TaxID=688270 RepID=E6X4Q6_CELAD|nr:SCO family protein [Cellulophaga algicola]ADV49381.1 electron transport protein SCO1/SenC [Cellulophaga algicola DSM 14237]
MGKSKYTYIWVSFIILVFGIIFIPKIIDRVYKGTVVESDRMSIDMNNGNLAFIVINGEKRKVPDFAFVNQDSLLITNNDYKGKVYVVEFFFTTCPSICPIMNQNLVQIQSEFKEFDDFGVASFTINPTYDTPTVLKEYAEKYGVTNLNWNLMTGDAQGIYDLANSGFNIFASEVPSAPGGFEHAGMFALVDRNGYIRSRVDDFGNPMIYYRGTITEEDGVNDQGEQEQIGILKEDIQKLLEEK